MKTKSTTAKFFRYSATAIALSLLLMQPLFALTTAAKKRGVLTAKDPVEDKPVKKSNSFKKNNNWIKIYPDPLKKIMHVVARQNKGKEVDFFVFDLEGTLVLNYKMKSKERHRIVGLPKDPMYIMSFAETFKQPVAILK